MTHWRSPRWRLVADRQLICAGVVESDDTTRPHERSADPAATPLAGGTGTTEDDLARRTYLDAEDAADW
jgi:hypothetical protein